MRKMNGREMITIYEVNIWNRVSIFARQTGQGCPNSIICWLQLEQQFAWRHGIKIQVVARGDKQTTQLFA